MMVVWPAVALPVELELKMHPRLVGTYKGKRDGK